MSERDGVVSSPWRNRIRRVHVWLGFALLLPLSLVAFSGAGLSFAQQADRVIAPELWTISPPSNVEPVPLARIIEIIERRLPGMQLERLDLPERRQDTAVAQLIDGEGEQRQVFVDPFREVIVGERLASADPRHWLGSVHRKLSAGRAGQAVVIAASTGVIVLLVLGWVGRRYRQGGDGARRWHRRLVWLSASLWSVCALTAVFALAAGHSLNDNHPPPAVKAGTADTLAGACEGRSIDTIWWRDDGRAVVRCRAPGSFGPFGVGYDAGHGAQSGAGIAAWLTAVHTGEVFGVGGRVLWFWGTLLLPLAMWFGLIAFWHRRRIERGGAVGSPTTEGETE